jgi:uncharacterized protein
LPFFGVAVLAAGAAAIAYFSTHPPRCRIRRTPADIGADFEEVTFPSADGTGLSGWWIPAARPRAVLLLCHGMSAHREQLLPWASWLREAGFSLLLFDFRAMGQSEGDLCTMGLFEPEDVVGAVDYLKSRPDARELPLGALGFSMGGVSIMIAAARDERIEAISTLGSYTGLDRAIAQRCRRHFGPLGPVVEKPARKLGAKWFPGDPLEVDCLAAVRKLGRRPSLFANGTKDPIVPPRHAEDLLEAASGPKEIVLLPHTAHSYPAVQDRQSYEDAVLGFFCRTLTRDGEVEGDY